VKLFLGLLLAPEFALPFLTSGTQRRFGLGGGGFRLMMRLLLLLVLENVQHAFVIVALTRVKVAGLSSFLLLPSGGRSARGSVNSVAMYG